VPGPLPQRRLRIVRGSGELRLVGGGALDARLVASWSWITFRGRELASTTLAGADAPRIVLWQLDGPPRIETQTEGMRPNGDVFDEATLTVFDCTRGSLELSAFAKADETVTLSKDTGLVDTRQLTSGQPWTVAADTAGRPGHACRFRIQTTALLAVTRFTWSRSSSGSPRARRR
jgi:hypothetical protein